VSASPNQRMTAKLPWLLIFFAFVACNASFRPEWNLPVKLGAAKSEVYGILGKPSYQGAEDIEWFQNSGLAIDYDPAGKVSSIIVHGQSNSSFITYLEPSDLRFTDHGQTRQIVCGVGPADSR
jgi:hypothetical protein